MGARVGRWLGHRSSSRALGSHLGGELWVLLPLPGAWPALLPSSPPPSGFPSSREPAGGGAPSEPSVAQPRAAEVEGGADEPELGRGLGGLVGFCQG